jgi:DNA-binding SARP family transcriptional activator
MPADVGLTLRLFGTPSFAGAGTERASALLAKPKALALLAYLAIARPRGLRRRDEILALLWPESDAERARNSLRQSLFMLRTHLPLGALASRGRDAVGLASIGVDVRTLTAGGSARRWRCTTERSSTASGSTQTRTSTRG